MAGFLEDATARLGLNGQEGEFVTTNRIRSFDLLHALLQASPDIAERIEGVRRDVLLGELRALLSPDYRRALAAPPQPWSPQGARLSVPRLDPGMAGEGPLPDWPALGKPESLAGAHAIDLRENIDDWPPRDQGGNPTCVAFAATAALELSATRQGTPDPLSPLFLYSRVRARMEARGGSQAAGALAGATKLAEATEILNEEGICTQPDWPDDKPLQPGPGRAEIARARRCDVDCWDLGVLRKRWPGPARAVWELLAQDRAVAISLPEFRSPASGDTDPTNWSLTLTLTTGEVPDPPADWVQAPVGHAVCIVGFQPSNDEPMGGWFTFRNSHALRFAVSAPNAFDRTVPIVPGQGYGTISASLLHQCVYEIMAPR